MNEKEGKRDLIRKQDMMMGKVSRVLKLLAWKTEEANGSLNVVAGTARKRSGLPLARNVGIVTII
jgi:hypothetical protein